MAARKATIIDDAGSPLRAWCYSCTALTKMTRPGPMKTVYGTAMREGTCGRCGASTWRVGGGKAEGHE